jgi:hypothetical protein
MNIFVLAAGLLLLSGTARAQPHGQVHSPTMTHPTPHPAQPSEPGQSAFAAIQEIVAILEADPATDWAKVDIEALRQHLIDMNAVTLNAEVVAEPIDRVRGSIRRMVMAHAATMNGVGGWMFKAEETSAGAVLTVTVSNPAEVAKVRALGFIGVLTHGMHHQAHHQMIASGRNPHG